MLYCNRNIFRLCRIGVHHKSVFIHTQAINEVDIKQNNEKETAKHNSFQSLLLDYKDKISFNSYLEHEKLELGNFKYLLKTIKKAKITRQQEYENKSLPPMPVALQYFVDKDRLLKEGSTEETSLVSDKPDLFQLPFGNTNQVEIKEDDSKPVKPNASDDKNVTNIDRWMTNYEYFDDTKLSEEEEHLDGEWQQYYGTPDPSYPVRRVPCGGCGALLHCTDPAIPGYLPSEILKFRTNNELKTLECQRCHFLQEFNIALDVTVKTEEYEKLLQNIRYVKSLVLLMVDLLDFPCSVWPGIVDIIGTDRPLIVVANKVDLIPGDSYGYLKRIRESLVKEINKTKLKDANIKHIALVSAKTGYGVEDLITAMFKTWLYKGDVFLVGCTNVGKSSLFNALLQSDYCKVHATDIVKRATVSRWPGTTLHLLKFPINRPSGWKLYERNRRLKSEAKSLKIEQEIRKAQLRGKVHTEIPSLIGHIGRSFTANVENSDSEIKKLSVMDEKHKLFANSKWFYDTPGVMHPDQVLSLLSTEELLLTIPKKLLRPQTYYLYEGSSIFIGGLARVDVVHSSEPCRLTVFCSECLPLTVTKTEDAELVYDKFVGTELFAVPTGGDQRMKNWPGLKKCENPLEFVGQGPKACCGDVVLSSVGWIAVTAKGDSKCKLLAWTPEGRGIYKRTLSLLPFAINLKGKRIRDTPAYMIGNVFSEDSE